MGKLVAAVLGSILTLLIASGGPLVWYLDHSFAGYTAKVGPKLPFIPCCQVSISIPPGIAVRDAQALAEARSGLLAARGQADLLRASLMSQNAAIDLLSKDGQKSRADLAAAGLAYQARLAAVMKKAPVILALGNGPGDVCTRAQKVDDAFLQSLTQ